MKRCFPVACAQALRVYLSAVSASISSNLAAQCSRAAVPIAMSSAVISLRSRCSITRLSTSPYRSSDSGTSTVVLYRYAAQPQSRSLINCNLVIHPLCAEGFGEVAVLTWPVAKSLLELLAECLPKLRIDLMTGLVAGCSWAVLGIPCHD